MNQFYIKFIEQARTMASERGIEWNMQIDEKGMAKKFWNLTLLAGATPPPNMYLRHFSVTPKAVDLINIEHSGNSVYLLSKDQSLLEPWQELIKAVVIEQLFYRRNTPVNIINNIIPALRLIATCAFDKHPCQISIDELNVAIRIGNMIQKSGKLGDLVKGIVLNVCDAEHIANKAPLYPSLSTMRLQRKNQRARYTKTKDELRKNLEDRKRVERLPERKAFWEMIRIIFTEQPKTFVDELRFIILKLLLTCGLRIGEGVTVPADWKRVHEYFSTNESSTTNNGYSSSLMLRHYAEKQQKRESDSTLRIEATQYVPHIFQDLLIESMDRALALTEPLRRTLRKQIETQRMLPWYEENDLVSTIDLYPILTGNPFLLRDTVMDQSKFIERYNDSFNPSVLYDLKEFQQNKIKSGGMAHLDPAFYQFYKRLQNTIISGNARLRFYRKDRSIFPMSKRMLWKDVHIRIGELEEHIKEHMPTKVSDTMPMRLSDGLIQTWELLFLLPKRSLAEERNGGLCDVTQYMSINRPDPTVLIFSLSDSEERKSIFWKYGKTDEDRSLSLTSHSLRHLQNTELFRLGVADTIITKRFNRKNVMQSYEYDHRSLAEDLDQIELPDDIENMLGEKASITARMILSGKATGPLVEGFRRIQRLEGDEAAFQYLKGEADGFHATPYGYCLNSFTVDPCPKNLECFAGCRHLAASNLSSNIKHLTSLEKKLKAALEEIERRPTTSIGRDNQIKHVQIRLEGIHRLLTAKEGCLVFPEGPDLSITAPRSLLYE